MSLNSEQFSNLEEVNIKWGTIQSKVIKFSYTWTVENFSYFSQKTECIKSSEFCAGDNDEYQWKLILYPRGVKPEYHQFLSAYLQFSSSKTPKVMCKYKFSVINGKGDQIKVQSQTVEAEECKIGGIVGFPKFIERNILISNYLVEDNLTILCEASFVDETVATRISGPLNRPQQNGVECKLSEDLNNLVLNKDVSDVIVETGGQEIQAQNAVLAGQSDAFAALLEKNIEDRVAVKDIDAEIIKEIENFVHTEKATDFLLAAADKYALNNLKLMCEQVLLKNLSVETAADTLLLAHLHNSNQLKTQTIHFIKSHFKDVKDTKGWKNMILTFYGSNLLAEIIATQKTG